MLTIYGGEKRFNSGSIGNKAGIETHVAIAFFRKIIFQCLVYFLMEGMLIHNADILLKNLMGKVLKSFHGPHKLTGAGAGFVGIGSNAFPLFSRKIFHFRNSKFT